MANTAAAHFDVDAARARFTALQRPLAFFDGPGGTQVPDEVIDAISAHLRRSMANTGAPYETSRRTDALVEHAHERAAAFLGCTAGEVAFGPSMTSLNFLITRAFGRDLREGDEVLVTKLDHDGNVAPWLHLADDIGIVVRFVDVHDDLSLDLDDLEAKLGPEPGSSRSPPPRTPSAPHRTSGGSSTSRTGPARSPGATPSTTARTARSTSRPGTSTCCSARRTSSSALTWVSRTARTGFSARCARTRCVRPPTSPSARRFELGTLQHELLAGFVAAVDYVDSIGWDAITAYERALGERFLAGLPAGVTLHGLPTMRGRVPTFCFSVEGHTAEAAATHLGERDLAVWWGNYYALETIRRIGVDEEDGAVRVGIVHTNTADEVDRLLAAIAELT